MGSESNQSVSVSELIRYSDTVDKQLDEKSDKLFSNNSSEYAAIVLRKFIDSAEKTIHILCGKLGRDVYEDSYLPLKRAVQNGVEVKVITSTEDVESDKILNLLKRENAVRHIEKWPEDFIRQNGGEFPHFTVIDGCRFRIETDREKREAVACAHAGGKTLQYAKAAEDAFQIFWNAATPFCA